MLFAVVILRQRSSISLCAFVSCSKVSWGMSSMFGLYWLFVSQNISVLRDNRVCA